MSQRNACSIAGVARLQLLAAGFLALGGLIAATASQAAEVTVSGCPQAGVEAGCILLKADDGKLYNVSAAEPKPEIGVAGTATGTVSDGASLCMQGIALSPARWQPTPGASCPSAKSQ